MRALLPVTLIAAIASTATLAGPVASEPGIQKIAFGLRAPAPNSVWRVDEDTDRLQLRGHDLSYDGVREIPHLGLYSVESYSGVFLPLSDRWGSSLEVGVSRDSPIAAPRYSIGGQLHTTLLPGHGLSLGLKLNRAERAAPGAALAGRLDPAGAGDALLADRLSGGSGYELNVNYLYGTRYSVRMAYQQSNAGHFYAPHGLTPGLRSFALTGQHWLTPNWSMSYDIYASDPATLLQSPGFGLGLRYRF
jgi:hypothetical protein